jgi:hypothetical protein
VWPLEDVGLPVGVKCAIPLVALKLKIISYVLVISGDSNIVLRTSGVEAEANLPWLSPPHLRKPSEMSGQMVQ